MTIYNAKQNLERGKKSAIATLKKNGWELVGEYKGQIFKHTVRNSNGVAYSVQLSSLLYRLSVGDKINLKTRVIEHDKPTQKNLDEYYDKYIYHRTEMVRYRKAIANTLQYLGDDTK